MKGCLHNAFTQSGMLFTLILYDSVAGGAGHVRRMVTDDGKAFQKVILAAIHILEECECDTSCYHCLRNYYNQKIHDVLNRKLALQFLYDWAGTPEAVESEAPAVRVVTEDGGNTVKVHGG